jgi:hypothetical protein
MTVQITWQQLTFLPSLEALDALRDACTRSRI